MPGTSNFEYDIFISYAHVDNRTINSDDKGWVAEFHEHLELKLSRRIGRIGSVKIWRDPALDGNQVFNDAIREIINRSALFLALTSNGYLASENCQKELVWFDQKARAEPCGLMVGDRMRIFNVLLNNIRYEEWPAEFGHTSGFRFHDATREDELGEPSDPKEKPFQTQLRELTDSIFRMLSELKENSQEAKRRDIEDPRSIDDSFTVYLADTADSLSTIRKRLVSELRQNRIHTVSSIPPPYEADPHEQKAITEISKANISVHLFDNLPGREIENAPGKSYPQKQAELGLRHARSQFIWVPQTLDIETIEDEAYKRFLDQLENGKRDDDSNYSFIRETPSAITRELLEKVNQLKRAPKSAGLTRSALVDTHLKDQMYALDLSKFLLENAVQPYINPEEDDPRKNMTILEERLKQVSMLIIIFGHVAEDWVRERLGAALQFVITEKCPLKACSIYLAPPRKEITDVRFNEGFFQIDLINNSEFFDPRALTPLLDRIASAGGS